MLDVPAFAETRLLSNRRVLTGSANGELLARSPIDFPSPLALEWVLTSPDAVAAMVRPQTHWTLAVLGTSLFVSACGLFAILRMVREERRLNQLKGQFVSSVTHELRAPLGSIQLMADALEEDRVESPKVFHSRIGQECQRLSHLIENVLDLARIEEGHRLYQFEETKLATLVEDAANLFALRAANSQHTLEIDLDPGKAIVDRAAVEQAVANLLDNALRFSPKASTISLTLTWDESAWALAVIDEGPGIPQSEHERIFERFYRLGDELRRETKGTGIGLSVVKSIAEAHGGTVRVTNGPTNFTVRVPIQPPVPS